MDTSWANARLTERADLTADLCIVRIRPDSGNLSAFEPGQFATLGLLADDSAQDAAHDPFEHLSAKLADHHVAPDSIPIAQPHGPPAGRLIRRAYSIASSATIRDHVELYVALVPEGRFTPRFWRLRPGAPIWVDPHIHGKFTLANVPHNADLVMVATGTGIAPYISMIRTYRGQRRWNRLAILHGVRRAADLGYRSEMESVATQDHNITYLPMVTREPAESHWSGLRGRVTTILDPAEFADLAGWSLDPSRAHVMLCGNPQMINDSAALLTSVGFAPTQRTAAGNLHFERYW